MFSKMALIIALVFMSQNSLSQNLDFKSESGWQINYLTEQYFIEHFVRLHKDGVFKEIVDFISPEPASLQTDPQGFLMITHLTNWSINKIPASQEMNISMIQNEFIAGVLYGEPLQHIYRQLLDAGGLETIESTPQSMFKKVVLNKFSCSEKISYDVPSEYRCDFRVSSNASVLKVDTTYGFQTVVESTSAGVNFKYKLKISDLFLQTEVGSSLAELNPVLTTDEGLFMTFDVGSQYNQNGVDLNSIEHFAHEDGSPQFGQQKLRFSKNQGYSLASALRNKPGSTISTVQIGNQTIRKISNILEPNFSGGMIVNCQQIVGFEKVTSVCDFIYLK